MSAIALLAQFQPTPTQTGGGAATAKSCVGTPGNTTGLYQSQCQTTTGAIYACNNSAGCSVAADWVGATLPSQAANSLTGNNTGSAASPVALPAGAVSVVTGGGTVLRDVKSAKDSGTFGCTVTGNGSTDDGTCLNTVLNTSVFANYNLLIPQGKYNTTSALTAIGSTGSIQAETFNLIGQGQASTVVNYVGGTAINSVLTVSYSTPPTSNFTQYYNLRDFSVLAGANTTYALNLQRPASSSFSNITLQPGNNANGYCVYLYSAVSVMMENLNCYGNYSGRTGFGGVLLDGVSTSDQSDHVTLIAPNLSFLGNGPAIYAKSISGAKIIAAHTDQVGTALQVDSTSIQVDVDSSLFELSQNTDSVLINGGETVIENAFVANGNLHIGSTATNTEIIKGSIVPVTTQIDAGARNTLIENSVLGSNPTDNGTNTVYENNVDTSGNQLRNFPAYQHCTMITGGIMGGSSIDPQCVFQGTWEVFQSGAVTISPVVFTTGKAWTAVFVGSWLNYGVTADNTLPPFISISDSNPTITGTGGVMTFSVNGSGNFQMSRTQTLSGGGFSGTIYFTPQSSVTAGSGFSGSVAVSGTSSAASLSVGSAAQFKVDINGLIHLNGAAPTASSGTVTGTNSGGYVSGLSAATTVTLTFSNGGFTTWASCNGTPSVSLATPIYVSAQSNTACTFTMPALTGTLYYHVDGK